MCAEILDDNIFFIDKGGTYNRAKALCAKCDVVEQCLEYANRTQVTSEEIEGFYGGMTPNERRRMRGFGIKGRARNNNKGKVEDNGT